jgi:peptidoglycan hydrolase-like protein with peptidoglycan-binding domain
MGSLGEAVRKVQQRMRDRGWIMTVNGSFDLQMDQKVRAFQREKGLKPDGVVGPITWKALWTLPTR